MQTGRDLFRCLRCVPTTNVVRNVSVEVTITVGEVTYTAYLEETLLINNIFNIVDISTAYLAGPIEVGNLLERQVEGTYNLTTVNERQCVVGFVPQILKVLEGVPPPGMNVGMMNAPFAPPGMGAGPAAQSMDGMLHAGVVDALPQLEM